MDNSLTDLDTIVTPIDKATPAYHSKQPPKKTTLGEQLNDVKASQDARGKESTQAEIDKKIIDRYIFISSTNQFLDSTTGDFLSVQSLNNYMLDSHTNPKASTWLCGQKSCNKVSNVIYMPGSNEGMVYKDRTRYWNLWNKPEIDLPDTASNKDIEQWLDHLNYLYPDEKEQNHILNWFAFMLQHPEIKINHALLLAGNTRIGKDILLNPVRYGIGSGNLCEPPGDELRETFTDYLHHTKLIIFQEIRNFEKMGTENKLKPMLAAPPDMLRVRLFGRGFYETPNLIQAIFMSNYRDALHISEGDGRYFAVWSDAVENSPKYYTDFVNWLKGEGNALVVRWLLNRDISKFNPHATPPHTDFKKEMIIASHSPLRQAMKDMIDARDYPFGSDCVRPLDIERAMKNKHTQKYISQILLEMGFIKKECRRATREQLTLFAVRDIEKWKELKVSEWITEYDNRYVVTCGTRGENDHTYHP